MENRYAYDAFGNLLGQEEAFPNRILYAGQLYDQKTDQYYLRARYYNPTIGRFSQEDTYWGDGLNLYAYCANNPVRYFDPSGHQKKPNCPGTEGEAATDKQPGVEIEGGSTSKYLEQLDNLSENKINHMIDGSKNSNHGWEKLVPDKNWSDIKNIIADAMDTGVEGPYKSVLSKKATINGFEVEVTYTKLSDGTIKISDAWVNQ